MVNTTISIFCAAGIDFAVYRLLRMLLPEEQWESAERSGWFLISVLALACFVPVLLYCRLLQIDGDEHQRLFAWGTMGGHICAFLAILSFGLLQKVCGGKKIPVLSDTRRMSQLWVWVLPVLAFVAFLLLMHGGAYRVRRGGSCQLRTASLEVTQVPVSQCFSPAI